MITNNWKLIKARILIRKLQEGLVRKSPFLDCSKASVLVPTSRDKCEFTGYKNAARSPGEVESQKRCVGGEAGEI